MMGQPAASVAAPGRFPRLWRAADVAAFYGVDQSTVHRFDFGLGVVLRAPTDPGGDGGSASYRIDYRIDPALPDKPLARRKQRYARQFEEAYAKADAIFAEMKQRASGTYVEYATDVPFGQVVQRWYDSPHPRWGENYPAKVRTLLKCWVLDEGVTITRVSRSGPVPIADVPIGGLTADDYNQALEHVRTARAYRTYTEVHGLVVQIVKWAVANRYLRPTDLAAVQQMPLAVPDGEEEAARGSARAVPEDEIPPPGTIDALATTAGELRDSCVRTMIYLLAYTGMRISETLALRNDNRFVRDQLGGCWRIHVRQQVHKSRRKTLLPKWRKKRWAFVPTFLSDELTDLLDAKPDGALLFPSPGRKVRLDDGTMTRVGSGLHPYDHWRERVWTPIVERTPGWPERDDWWPPDAGPAPGGDAEPAPLAVDDPLAASRRRDLPAQRPRPRSRRRRQLPRPPVGAAGLGDVWMGPFRHLGGVGCLSGGFHKGARARPPRSSRSC